MLDTGDGNFVYWEACGNPQGVPALMVHGGPGSGCSAGWRRDLHPDRHRIILFDQRNCGRSRPHASDPAADMSLNTTGHLIRDMEQLRQHLGVDAWLLSGGSWGVTLSLAYAERFPERVSGLLLFGVTTTRRSELDWLYRGAGRIFPEAWERFRDFAGAGDYRLPTDTEPPVEGLLLAYSRLMENPDPGVRRRAAAEWVAWEDAVISAESNGSPGAFSDRQGDARLAFVRICSHYFAHGAFLEDGVLIREAGRLAGIPGILIQGRNDLGGPVITAWELARAWPGAELVVVADSGHTGSAAMEHALDAAADRLFTAISASHANPCATAALPRARRRGMTPPAPQVSNTAAAPVIAARIMAPSPGRRAAEPTRQSPSCPGSRWRAHALISAGLLNGTAPRPKWACGPAAPSGADASTSGKMGAAISSRAVSLR